MKSIILSVGLAVALCSTQIFANSFGVPERPTHMLPLDGEMDVSVSPTLISSEYQVLDDSSSPIDTAAITESEWLIYIENGVTLVGGTNLTGSDRDLGESILFDVSALTLTLSGSYVHYALVNHKRLELQDNSNNLLGYVELPDFFWHADNVDIYKAARFKKFSNAVVVEWHYGDDDAVSPWNMRLQARLENNELGLKLLDSSFDSDFVSNYGSNSIAFCDESLCYNHALINIYNTDANTAVCELPSLGSNCLNATLYSAGLDDLSMNAVEYGTSSSTSFAPMNPLMEVSNYTWVVRHKGTIDGTTQIAGGWSNATSFTTEMMEVPEPPVVEPPAEEPNLTIDDVTFTLVYPEGVLYTGMDTEFRLDVTNNAPIAIEQIHLDAGHHVYGNTITLAPECSYELNSEEQFVCNIDEIPAGETVSLVFGLGINIYGYTLDVYFNAEHVPSSTYISDPINLNISDSEVKDLNLLTQYEVTTNLEGSYLLKEIKEKNIQVTVKNIGQYAGNDTLFWFRVDYTHVTVTSHNCQYESIDNLFTYVRCYDVDLGPDDEVTFHLDVQSVDESRAVNGLTLQTSTCENSRLDVSEYHANCNNLKYRNFKIEIDSEDESGGTLWFLPLLGLFLARRKAH